MNSYTRYTVAVRALCEFTARKGDLDVRLTASPSGQDGIAGHLWIASQREDDYETEIPLAGEFGALRVRGRADGFDPRLRRLEEIKTYRGDFDAISESRRHLHWTQARIYGYLLCLERGWSELRMALVYLDIDRHRETVLEETWSADALRKHFDDHCGRFLAWAEQEMAHRKARDDALTALAFPHPDFRAGQRPLAEAVYRAARAGRCLAVQAPTGIGKTVGTLFPLLKAMPGENIDKIFYLTAKTPGRQLALHALRLLESGTSSSEAAGSPRPRVLELIARDKSCEHPDAACTPASCPLAQGFYDRLPAARQQAAEQGWLDKESLRAIALDHQVCPYFLAQEMIRWCDVIVGDYNHYFDTSAILRALTVEDGWRTALLVDEAHNLLDRARGMFTAEISGTALRDARRAAPRLKRVWTRIARAWQETLKPMDASLPYQTFADLPGKLAEALRHSAADIGDDLAEHPQGLEPEVQQFFFDLLHFVRMADEFGEHSIADLRQDPESGPRERMNRSTICLRNVVPAPFLKPSLELAHTATLFSATFSPASYYRDMLGLPDDTARIEVDSPFHADQLTVHIAHDISTRYAQRAQSIAPIVSRIARQYHAQPGNYLAFFSSFEYLEQAASALEQSYSDLPQWRQSRRMGEAERQQFLDRFTPDGQGIGFAVLGGAFAEGIDLPGNRLIGAFIATLGLPQVNAMNEQFRLRLEQLFGQGYDYAYLYPGLQKVVQAAGRVIRTTQDQGVIHLMDDRYTRRQVRQLLPTWWKLDVHPGNLSPTRQN